MKNLDMTPARYRIGIDVGGTFTDFILADMTGGRLILHKEPSVPGDPSLAVERGTKALLATHGIAPDAVELVVHGTTIGLNAIIQRRGARLALVVSRGNRDVLEIARLRLPSSYDVTEPREAPLIPRDLVFEIGARMRSDGTVIEPVSEDEVAAVAAQPPRAGRRCRRDHAAELVPRSVARNRRRGPASPANCLAFSSPNPAWYGPRCANTSAAWWRASTPISIR